MFPSKNDQGNASPGFDEENDPKHGEEEVEEEEEEEEDDDFNPFLKGTPSPEASSSLSSEVEGLDVGGTGNLAALPPNEGNEVQDFAVGDLEHGEEVVMMNEVCDGSEKKRRGLMDRGDDAICKRTRARYSLASFTLDELEMFLQETDDEDDLPNVDDEEEYRKFLAAVMQGGGDGDDQTVQENGSFEEDEDEENDADFEIELEELLESDVDDVGNGEGRKGERGRDGRRPETRQNRRQKASADYQQRLLEQTKRPLCPLLPILPNAGFASYPIFDGNASMPEYGSSFGSSSSDGGLINGFTSQQIGQLHCLIHEHVQLLVQVFSLSVLDATRQHVASQVQNLISEMLHKRDEAVAHRSLSYPDVCFCPPNVFPSVAMELPNSDLAQYPAESPPASHMLSMIPENSPSGGKQEHVGCRQMRSLQSLGSFWLPFVSGPITSILDVAPLNLVGTYVDDVHNAVREYRQHLISSGCDTLYQKEPLFNLPNFVTLATLNGEVVQGDAPLSGATMPLLPGQQPPKKSLAASIVEKAKTQSIALVQRDISKLAQRFFPLFNPALFPHKPPPMAVANRVLFTDVEDELLALGILEFNSDWKAIQQHFLPCKSKHQIFVRQKNRSSSKAPENPIKAVRRLKSSPLTAEEKERIQEGLRIFKFDWPSIWRFAVPYRDPSLLPRQWRTALGTQRSYKSDAARKEKRRTYEFNKRLKVAAQCQLASEKDNQANHLGRENNNGNDCADDANETYVHRAFLADWKPGGTYIREQQNHYAAVQAQYFQQVYNTNKIPYASNFFPYPRPADVVTYGGNYASAILQPIHHASVRPNASESQIDMLPHHTRRAGGIQVKLAPGLPPVNLPPSVRVIPQSAFKGNQCGVPGAVSASKGVDGRKASTDLQNQHIENMRTNSSTSEEDTGKQVTDKVSSRPAQECTTSNAEELMVLHEACTDEGRVSDPVLEMHPLLFQAPEDGHLRYYPLSSATGTSSSFTFFSGNQPQLNLSLVHSSHQTYHGEHSNRYLMTKVSNLESCGFDFHPLLQKTDDENQQLPAACSDTQQFVCMGDKQRQSQNDIGAVQINPLVSDDPYTGSPEPPSGCDKANELDLGIYLSSTSIKEKKQGSRGGDTYEEPTSLVGLSNHGNVVRTQGTDDPHNQCRGNRESVRSSLVAVSAASAIPSNSDSRCDIDDVGDQRHQEIVMEQEELSDSDEEIEEHVEFECEEMTDSDSEGLPCGPLPEEIDKAPSSTNNVLIDADHGHQQSELRSHVHPRDISSISRKSHPMPKLSLRSLAKDAATCSWLSLDSSALVDPPSMKAKHQHGEIDQGRAAKNLHSCHPNRSRKKTTSNMKRVATQRDVVDMARQLRLGPLAVSTLTKPRKRVSHVNSTPMDEMTTGTSSSTDKLK